MASTEISVADNRAFDPFVESVGQMLVVAFPKSNSKNFPFAVHVAESAYKYVVAEINGMAMHIAVLGFTNSDAGKARLLLDYTRNWKGTLVFHNGSLLGNVYNVSSTIDCYITAEACIDKKAHCNTVFYSYGQDKQFLFPCKFIAGYFRPDSRHPSTIQDQIQALAVERNCDWCPNFDPDAFVEFDRESEEKIVVDVF